MLSFVGAIGTMVGAGLRLWPSLPVELAFIVFGIGLLAACAAVYQWMKDRSFTPASHVRLAADLRQFAGTPANVKILFARNDHRPIAETLESIFRLAGWETNLTNVPLEQYQQEQFDGVQVRGVNGDIVRSVARALKRAGLRRVREQIEPNNVLRENPKWSSVEHHVRITVGHQ